jgi:hypothetical protein
MDVDLSLEAVSRPKPDLHPDNAIAIDPVFLARELGEPVEEDLDHNE